MTSVRPARPEDLPAMARLAAQLVRQHHAVDPLRFMLPDGVERGYERWFRSQLPRPEVVMRVAEGEGGEVVGYTYATVEGLDWNMLLGPHAELHDIFVDEKTRGSGVGRELLAATLDGLRALGAPRVVLSTMWSNEAAQRLFEKLGFRKTRIEMTAEL